MYLYWFPHYRPQILEWNNENKNAETRHFVFIQNYQALPNTWQKKKRRNFFTFFWFYIKIQLLMIMLIFWAEGSGLGIVTNSKIWKILIHLRLKMVLLVRVFGRKKTKRLFRCDMIRLWISYLLKITAIFSSSVTFMFHRLVSVRSDNKYSVQPSFNRGIIKSEIYWRVWPA